MKSLALVTEKQENSHLVYLQQKIYHTHSRIMYEGGEYIPDLADTLDILFSNYEWSVLEEKDKFSPREL